jgi:hypothetical protein
MGLQTRPALLALALTPEEFAERYHVPLGTLRDWEQGRSEPDQAAKAYLNVIARDPKVSSGHCILCAASWRKLLTTARSLKRRAALCASRRI